MRTYVAFLRGMNLGRRRICNDELCAAFRGLGYQGVSAFLASGNVIFQAKPASASKLERAIAHGLQDALGYAVPAFVRTSEQVVQMSQHAPFSGATLARTSGNLQVALLAGTPSTAKRKAALALSTPDDQLAIKDAELYWLPLGKLSDSELDLKGLASTLGAMTIRTQRTLVRLSAKLPSGD